MSTAMDGTRPDNRQLYVNNTAITSFSTAIDKGKEPASVALGTQSDNRQPNVNASEFNLYARTTTSVSTAIDEGEEPASVAVGTQSDNRQPNVNASEFNLYARTTTSVSTAIDEGEEPASVAVGTLVDNAEVRTGKAARRWRKSSKRRERAAQQADKIAATEDSPNGKELQRSTRRALAFKHGNLYDREGFMRDEEYQKRFCNICQVRFDEKTLHSSHCSCPGRVCEPCRVEQLFGEIERHETVIGKCSFCRVQMESLPKVPSKWSSRLNVHGPDGIHQWNELGELFRQVGNPVRTIFPGADGKPEHITLSVGGSLVWQGNETQETELRLRSGGRFMVAGPLVTDSSAADTIAIDRLSLVDPRRDPVLRRQIAKEELALERYPIWRSWALRREQIYNETHLDPSSPW